MNESMRDVWWTKPDWYDEYMQELQEWKGLPRKRVVCPICNKLIKLYENVWGQISTQLCKECVKSHDPI